MNPELDQALCERYPLIFQAPDASQPTRKAVRWGFRCGDGWYTLIDVLCEQLQYETDGNGAPQVVAEDIKEKYGGLRFNANGASAKQSAMIDLIEALSLRICETCGAPGQLDERPGVWMTTRCTSHRKP